MAESLFFRANSQPFRAGYCYRFVYSSVSPKEVSSKRDTLNAHGHSRRKETDKWPGIM